MNLCNYASEGYNDVNQCYNIAEQHATLQAGRALAHIVRRRHILSQQGIPYRPSTHWLLGDVRTAVCL